MSAGSSIDQTRKSPLCAVELDLRVPGRARRLLVGGEQRVLERADEAYRPRCPSPSRSAVTASRISRLILYLPSSIRLPRAIASYGTATRSSAAASVTSRSDAASTSPRKRLRPATSCAVRTRDAPADGAGEVLAACGAGARGPARRRRASSARGSRAATPVTRSQSAWSTPSGWSTYTREPLGPAELDGEHLDVRQAALDRCRDLAMELSFPLVHLHIRSLSQKMGAARPLLQCWGNVVADRIAATWSRAENHGGGTLRSAASSTTQSARRRLSAVLRESA